jgi:hypothetical protein
MFSWCHDNLINIYQWNSYILNLIYTIGEMYSYLTRCGSQSINQSGSQSVLWIIFYLYHGENKLHSMRWWWCLLCSRPTRLVLTNYDNSSQVDMSPHSDTLSRFRANYYFLFLLNGACWAEKQQITILFLWFVPTGARICDLTIQGEHYNHYTIDTVVWNENIF